jgi:hypothetical protein
MLVLLIQPGDLEGDRKGIDSNKIGKGVAKSAKEKENP